MSETGLYVTDTEKIGRISGPVSFSILVPDSKSDYCRRYPNAPVFMLFGDVHDSTKNLCTGADPDTYTIYKIEFLQKISKALKDGEIIDFYTEGSDMTGISDHEGPEHETPLQAMYTLVSQCNRLRETQNAQYKTIEKIKWHHTDIRFWDHTSAQAQAAKKEMLTKKSWSVKKFLDRIRDHATYDKKEGTFCNLFISFVIALKESGYTLEDKFLITPELIYEEYVTSPHSLINYQLSKIKDETARQFLMDKIKLYIPRNHAKEIRKINDVDPKCVGYLQIFHNSIIKCFNKIDRDNQADHIEQVKKIFQFPFMSMYLYYVLYIETLQLEMFTFAKSFTRMLEPADGHSIINICYFGDAHITGMTYFLTDILKAYNRPLFIECDQTYNRCLDLNKLGKHSLVDILNSVRQPAKGAGRARRTTSRPSKACTRRAARRKN